MSGTHSGGSTATVLAIPQTLHLGNFTNLQLFYKTALAELPITASQLKTPAAVTGTEVGTEIFAHNYCQRARTMLVLELAL